ncbi:MAG: ABC transporter substrate-binding protein [Lachnospiraceae bacterium]
MKKILTLLLAVTVLFSLTACSNSPNENTTPAVSQEDTDKTAETTESTIENSAAEPLEDSSTEPATDTINSAEPVTLRIGSLKGPTSLGLLPLMQQTELNYEYTMATAADELLPLMIKGELDIALIPANVASILYNKMEGELTVIDINTLGVLYLVSADTSVTSFADLAGKTIYLTGKGTTPDYTLQYLLLQSEVDLSTVTLEYKSEATEVAAVLAENPEAYGFLPQPFVTAACMQNESLQVLLSASDAWDELSDDSRMVTGVTVVRNEILEQYPEAIDAFIEAHAASTSTAMSDVESTAALAVEHGIIAKEAIAVKAIPECNLVTITGDEMKEALSGYLNVLYKLDASSVGGTLPDDSFYY